MCVESMDWCNQTAITYARAPPPVQLSGQTGTVYNLIHLNWSALLMMAPLDQATIVIALKEAPPSQTNYLGPLYNLKGITDK